MKGNLRVVVAACAASFVVSACAATDDGGGDGNNPVVTPGLDDDFAAAGDEHGVPPDLLRAIAYVETRWQMVTGTEEVDGRPAGAGVFALWGDNLVQGAAAAGVSEDDARTDVDANIAAGAARLAGLAQASGISGTDLVAWSPAIAAFAQTEDGDARAAYVQEVLGVLQSGASAFAEDGELIASIDPHREIVIANLGSGVENSTDYGPAIWRSSPNYNSRGGHSISLVVIHDCEGNYAGCWGWLRNTAAGASAHYVVNESGSEITQLVREADRAWHVAA